MVVSWSEWEKSSPFLYVDTLDVLVNGKPGVVEHELIRQREPGVFVFPNTMLVKDFDSFYADFFESLKFDGLCQVLASVQLPILDANKKIVPNFHHSRYFTPLVPGLPSASRYLERCAMRAHVDGKHDKVDFGWVLHSLWPSLFPNTFGWYFKS